METSTQKNWFRKKRYIIPSIIIAGFIALANMGAPAEQSSSTVQESNLGAPNLNLTSPDNSNESVSTPDNEVEVKTTEPTPTAQPSPNPTTTTKPSGSQTSNQQAKQNPTPVPTPTPTTSSEPVVKKSNSDICHAKGTEYYSRTKNYTPYSSIDSCLASGGRLPK